MPKRFLIALIVSSLSVTGCELLKQSNLTLSRGSAELVVVPQIVTGGYRAQALVAPFTAKDIDHLVLKLFKLDGQAESPVLDPAGKAVVKVIPGAQLTSAVSFSALLPNTTYRIRAYAYKAEGESPSNLISTGDASSYTDITLTNDDQPVTATLKVKLMDVLFNGQATASGIVVTPGGYTTDEEVSIQLGPITQLIQPESPFWAQHGPELTPGMTWIYEQQMVHQGNPKTVRFRAEITALDASVVTYRIEGTMDGETQSSTGPMERARFGGQLTPMGMVYVVEGQESVTVPAGTFPNAYKLISRSVLEESRVWVVPGIGIVREEVVPIGEFSTTRPSSRQLVEFIP